MRIIQINRSIMYVNVDDRSFVRSNEDPGTQAFPAKTGLNLLFAGLQIPSDPGHAGIDLLEIVAHRSV